MRAIASGVGNHVVLIGSKTGRDGIGGASVLASQEFDETLEEKRPSVQVGDPFTEKKLIEACLELIHRKLVVSMQDLGAAGLTSSSSEMSSKGHVGLDIHADRVPLREADMEPWEIMISESQERMLAIVTDEQIADVREVCERWDLDCTVIGEVTDSKMLRIYWHGERVADIPARRLADESPVIRTPSVKPDYIVDEPVEVTDAAYPPPQDAGRGAAASSWPRPTSPASAGPGSSTTTSSRPTPCRSPAPTPRCCASRAPTAASPSATTATAATATSTRTAAPRRRRPRRRATWRAPARCPWPSTDCLNFGNPEKGEIYWQFEQAIEGMAEACEALDTPVVSGNVSFYNESFGQAIYPTPMVGMLGIFDDVSVHIDGAFKDEGDVVILLGDDAAWMDGSEYQKTAYGVVAGRIADVDLELEVELQRAPRAAIEARLLKSAHDCSEGGLAVALAECCVFSGSDGGAQFGDPDAPRPGRGRWLGAEVDLGTVAVVTGAAGRSDLALFGEAPTRVVVTCAPDKLAAAGSRPRRPAPPHCRPGCRGAPAVYHGGQGALRRPGERAPFCV